MIETTVDNLKIEWDFYILHMIIWLLMFNSW